LTTQEIKDIDQHSTGRTVAWAKSPFSKYTYLPVIFQTSCISHHPKLHPAAAASLPWLLSSAPSEPSAAALQSKRTA